MESIAEMKGCNGKKVANMIATSALILPKVVQKGKKKLAYCVDRWSKARFSMKIC